MRPFYVAAIIAAMVVVTAAVALVIIMAMMTKTNNSFPSSTTVDSSAVNTNERIDVRATPITISMPKPYFGTITGFHLFLAYVNATGSEFICEGLPFDPATGKAPSDSFLFSNPPGLVTRGYCNSASSGFYARLSSDVQSVTVLRSAREASQTYDCLVKKTAAFNAANVPYYMTTGPNSNSFVRTLLEHCKIPAMKPSGATVTPGWDLVINLGKMT